MTHRTSTNTAIEGTTPTLRFFSTEVLSVPEGAPLGRFGTFTTRQLQDWMDMVLAFQDTRLQELTGITIDLSEASNAYWCRGPGVLDSIVSITGAHNAVVAMLTAEALNRRPQIYRQAEASTVGDDCGQSSSTVMQRELTRYVEDAITRLFESAEDQNFEDGMESDFSRELVTLIRKYGDLAMSEVSYLITYDRVDREIASEALRWLGRIDDPSSYDSRLWVLEQSLSSKSPLVRDGAALGLASLRDANAVQYLRRAVERESIAELRCDLEEILEGLEIFSDATSVKDDSQA